MNMDEKKAELLNAALFSCKKDFEKLNIPYGKVKGIKTSSRFFSRLGSCKKVEEDAFEITLSDSIIKSRELLLNTLAHELLHTVPGCFNHGKKFKVLSNKINSAFPKYNITTSARDEESRSLLEEKAKYIIQCESCKAKIPRFKESKVTREIQKYRCGKCGGKLKVIKIKSGQEN